MQTELYLEVFTPTRVFFSGEVEAVIYDTPKGQLEILKNHSPMVCEVIAGRIQIKQNEKWMIAAVTEGFAEIIDNAVKIFIDTAEWPEEIDINRAIAAKQRAEERLQRQLSWLEYHRTQAALARALVRLKVSKKLE